ncbi:glycosyltransferase family 2 protein [Desulfurococcaceae archaeon MEX13E-LK6-19]|nr:glycosyltransferase family 2 protein [Desulfurococcaceae archaeon MEX13E-LK6-19]
MIELLATSIILTVYLLSITRSIISIIGILTNVYYKVWHSEDIGLLNGGQLPRILVILPLFRESESDIQTTLESIFRQDYPHNLLKIVIVVEQDDEATLKNVVKVISSFPQSNKGNISVLIKPGVRKGKATAVNYVLNNVKFGDIVAIYDGGDVVYDKQQFLKAALKINEGYDIVGSRVFRTGKGIIGRLVFFDTLIWIKIGLPSLAKILKTPLVSGEGLFLKRSFIEKIGGLPESLTEDAFLTIYAEKLGAKIHLLSSDVYEASPANISSLVRQRLRWYRGHIDCFLYVIKSKGISFTSRIKLLLTYSNPLLIASIALAYIALFVMLMLNIYNIVLLLSFLIVLSTLSAPLYILPDIEHRHRKQLLLLPIYWFFLGIIAFIALTLPAKIGWYKTERRQHVDYKFLHAKI